MRNLPHLAFNLFVFLLITYLLIIFQSSFRPFVHSDYLYWLPAPFNWLPVIAYLSLYRKSLEGIISVYFLLIGITVLTISNLGFLWLLGLAVFLLCQMIKSRIFWNGPQYFLLLCFSSTLLVQFCQLLLNLFIDDHFVWPNLFLWILSAIFTLIPAAICYYLLRWADSFTGKEPLTEVSSGSLL